MKKVRVRYAPSPTGYNHSGGIRTALYNYLFAKQHGGDFILRIEDTDSKRFVEDAEQYIRESLEWCGIVPDESPWNPNPQYGNYRQSERDYKEYAQFLVDRGFAYEDEGAIKFRIPEYIVKDEVKVTNIEVYDKLKGSITFNLAVLDDKVILKSDGTPTYHLASVVDDHLMEITHVFRGDEWINSYPLHWLLYEAFGWDKPEFIHLPVLLNPDGKGKLSKRTAATKGFEIFPLGCSTIDEKGNDVHFQGYKNLGFEPEAYINFLAHLGHTFSKDVLTMDELINEFSLDKLHHSPAVFDTTKLDFINRQHVINLPNGEIWKGIDVDSSIYSEDKLDTILDSVKKRVNLRKDFEEFVYPFFKSEKLDVEISIGTQTLLRNLFLSLLYVKNWDFNNIEDIKSWMKTSNIDKKELRMVVCSGRSGSDLGFVIHTIGKGELSTRILNYINLKNY